MTAIHIRGVPDEVVAALKRRAARNERSLQGELRVLLAAAARDEPPPAPLEPIRLHMSAADAETTWPREEIYGDEGR